MPNRPRLTRLKIRLLKWSIITLLTITLVMIIHNALQNYSPNRDPLNLFHHEIHTGLTHQMSINLMPILNFLDNHDRVIGVTSYIEAALLKQIPILYLGALELRREPAIEDEQTRDMLIRMEGRDEENKNIADSDLDYTEDALHIDNATLQSFFQENTPQIEDTTNIPYHDNQANLPQYEPFTPPQKPIFTYDWSQGFTFQELIDNFYAIDPTTKITEARINLKSLLHRDLTIKRDANNPQILIYHTHSLEAFADSIPGDPSTTIVGAGAHLAEILREKYGFNVIHNTTAYDIGGRDYAYTNALPDIEQILKDNPSIQLVIDLHRDEMREGKKLVMDLQGRPTARFMFFNGLSYTKMTGPIEYLQNPHINENLAFSFHAQVAANQFYPGITRKIYLKAYRYNMHVLPRTTLIELGAQTNTVEEIMNACEPLAHVISLVLNGY